MTAPGVPSALASFAAEYRVRDAAARGVTLEAYDAAAQHDALHDAQAAVAVEELALEVEIETAWVAWAAELAAGECLGLRHADGRPVRVRAAVMLRLDGLGARGAGNGAARGSVVHALIADDRGYRSAGGRLSRRAGQFLCRAGARPFSERHEAPGTAITCPRCLAVATRGVRPAPTPVGR